MHASKDMPNASLYAKGFPAAVELLSINGCTSVNRFLALRFQWILYVGGWDTLPGGILGQIQPTIDQSAVLLISKLLSSKLSQVQTAPSEPCDTRHVTATN